MSTAVDTFWDVQRVWEKTKNSPIALGESGSKDSPGSNARGPGAATPDGDTMLVERFLKILAERGSFNSYELSEELRCDHQLVVGTIKSVQSLGEVIASQSVMH